MAPSQLLFSRRRELTIKAGGTLVVVMDLFEITPAPQAGLFLEKYRLSWIAYEDENVERRVLIDSHPPLGIHYHLDNGPQILVELKTLPEAIQFFEKKVLEHFGELEGTIYEDLHV